MALAIADDAGLDAVTVRRVALKLDTGQASLYRYISDRGELLLLLAHEVATHLPVPPEIPDARERLLRQWIEAYDYLAQHSWAARIVADGEYALESGADFAEAALNSLRRVAGDPADAAAAYRVLWHLLLGHLLNSHPIGHTHSSTADATSEALGVTPEAPTTPGGASRSDYAWALPRVLDGLLGIAPVATC